MRVCDEDGELKAFFTKNDALRSDFSIVIRIELSTYNSYAQLATYISDQMEYDRS